MSKPRQLSRRVAALTPESDHVMRAAYRAFHERDLLLTPSDFAEGQQALVWIERAICNGVRADASLREFDEATGYISQLGFAVPPIDERLIDLLAQCRRVIRPTPFD